jgi:hypothetical protein
MNAPAYDTEKQAWIYPEAWTPELREQWEAIQGERIHHEKRGEAAAAAVKRATESPEALLSAAREATGAAKREADAAERRAAGEVAWRKALESHDADTLARIATVEGDIVILRTMTYRESVDAELRAQSLVAAAKSPRQAATDLVGAHLDALVKTVLHPDVVRLKALIEKRPGLVSEMQRERDKLTTAAREAEGKDFAP